MTSTCEERVESNYELLRQQYEMELVEEYEYPEYVAEETSNGWDEFLEREYGIYIQG